MQKRTFNEMISYFNRTVSEMEIGTEHKMTLLGMVTALGLAHEEEVKRKTGRWVDFSTAEELTVLPELRRGDGRRSEWMT